MIYSVGCEYGIRALTRLAGMAEVGEHVLLREILRDVDVPKHFVGKVFQSLVRADILTSAKGRGGGFALQRPANDIYLREVVEAIDGPKRLQRCILGLSRCDDEQPCAQHDAWKEIRRMIGDILETTSLQDLVKSLESKASRKPARRSGRTQSVGRF